MTTFGSLLVKHAIPEYDTSKALTKKELSKHIVATAAKDPVKYAKMFERAQSLGNMVSTYEGLTVGLDDIEPQYAKRDKILRKAYLDTVGVKDKNRKVKILLKTQQDMKTLSENHPGQMGLMVRSGGRGNAVQLMNAVNSPVLTSDSEDKPRPFLITRGYSEGLTPAQLWMANEEARRNAVKTNLSTSVPGELSKIMSNALHNQVVSSEDCGTEKGIKIDVKDASVLGRFTTGNKLVTPDYYKKIKQKNKTVTVRSPQTCEAHEGVCQRCMGQSMHGGLYDLGDNIGVRSAQTLSEPLTQMTLGSKHGGNLGSIKAIEPQGLNAVRQLLEIPKVFKGKATLSDSSGTVTSIQKAPQGGSFVRVGEKKHYIPPGFSVTVKAKQKVSAGDTLSDGMPNPQEVIKFKGLGEGRDYLVIKLHNVYKDSGYNIDRRYFEVLSKGAMNHVRILRPDPKLPFLPGEVVNYNRLKAESKKTDPQDLKYEHIMVPIPRVPLFNPDWMQRLGHREIKSTLTAAAQFGETSKLKGFNPVPPIVTGDIHTDNEAIY
jgi:DNA-directed RNA polymerase subunit beta'